MSDHQNEPREYDAVIGGQNSIPVNAVVLGGIAGVKSRLASPVVEARIAALSEALKYGEAGLELIVQALQDESRQVKLVAYSLLKDRNEEKRKKHLHNYSHTFEFDVITVDSYGKESSRRKSFAFYFLEYLGKSVALSMVYIPGGTFMMGSPATDKGRYNWQSPQHQVTVPAFYAGKYPITQAQWEAVMGNNPSYFKGEKLPVETVSWNDAVEFCRKLGQKTGKNYRLLSEAEWEYACRAGTTTPFYFGETITTDLVNHYGSARYPDPDNSIPKEISRQHTMYVGSFPPNAFGLYDMHGNVWEWCSDKCNQPYDGAPTDGSSWETGTSSHRRLRGGSYDSTAAYCHSAFRGSCNQVNNSDWRIGFRVALDFA
jgi:formylglycine-generating enzyme required for sulfatase activity